MIIRNLKFLVVAAVLGVIEGASRVVVFKEGTPDARLQSVQKDCGAEGSLVSIGAMQMLILDTWNSELEDVLQRNADVVKYTEEDKPAHMKFGTTGKTYKRSQPSRRSASTTGWKRKSDMSCPDVDKDLFQTGALNRATADGPNLPAGFMHNQLWGTGVDIYVLDTGVNCAHDDFDNGERCTWGWSADGETNDQRGHGTHCAGSAAGSHSGMARSAHVISVQVLGPDTNMSTVAMGVAWSVQESKSRGRRAVLSMSLGFDDMESKVLDEAVNAATDEGAIVVVSAGNDRMDACRQSPAAAEKAIVVGALEVGTNYSATPPVAFDGKARFSNSGSCVEIWAVGVDVLSASFTNPDEFVMMSGTSMATPIVAGAVAAYLSTKEGATATRDEVLQWLLENAQTKEMPGRFIVPGPKKVLHVPCTKPLHLPPLPRSDFAPTRDNCYETYVEDVDGERKWGEVIVPSPDVPVKEANACWRMQCLDGHRMLLEWVAFDVSNGNLRVNTFEGLRVSWLPPNLPTTLESGLLDMHLKTPEEERRGFHLRWACEPKVTTPAPTCSGVETLRNVPGGLMEFGMTDYGASEARCWELVCPAEAATGMVLLSELDIEDQRDFLTVDGERITGRGLPNPIMFQGAANATFVSDGSISGKGFNAAFDCVSPAFVSEWPATAGRCVETAGTTLLNLTGGYDNDVDVCWTLACPTEGSGFVSVLSIDLEPGRDFLTLDGAVVGPGVTPLPCGTSATLRFTSDVSEKRNGFSVLLYCVGAHPASTSIFPPPPPPTPSPADSEGCDVRPVKPDTPTVVTHGSWWEHERCWAFVCPEAVPFGVLEWHIAAFSSTHDLYVDGEVVPRVEGQLPPLVAFEGTMRLRIDTNRRGHPYVNFSVTCSAAPRSPAPPTPPTAPTPAPLPECIEVTHGQLKGRLDMPSTTSFIRRAVDKCFTLRCPGERRLRFNWISTYLDEDNVLYVDGKRYTAEDDLPSESLSGDKAEVRWVAAYGAYGFLLEWTCGAPDACESVEGPATVDMQPGNSQYRCWEVSCSGGAVPALLTLPRLTLEQGRDFLVIGSEHYQYGSYARLFSGSLKVELMADASVPAGGSFEVQCYAGVPVVTEPSPSEEECVDLPAGDVVVDYRKNASLPEFKRVQSCWRPSCPEPFTAEVILGHLNLGRWDTLILREPGSWEGDSARLNIAVPLEPHWSLVLDSSGESFRALVRCAARGIVTERTRAPARECEEKPASRVNETIEIYSGAYENKETRCWTLRCPDDTVGQVSFYRFDLESGDVLKLGDDVILSTTRHSSFLGKQTLSFVADETATGTGFDAAFTCFI